MGVIWTFVIMFFYCEAGERVTHQFNIFHEEISHSDWYLFPIETRRMFIVILLNTQEPTIIQGYANAVCTREAFKKV